MPFDFTEGGTSGGTSDSFKTIQVDAGTNPVADSATDVLTLTSSDGSILITGNSATDTIDLTVVGGAAGGDVDGPASATDNAIARFDGTTGKLIQNSGATLSDLGVLSTANVTITSLTSGSILFAGSGGDVSEDNTNLFWDNSNDRLAVGQNSTNVRVNSNVLNVKFTVDSSGGTDTISANFHKHATTTESFVYLMRSRGTNASPTVVQSSDIIGTIAASAYTGNSTVGYQDVGQLSFEVASTGTISTTSMPGTFKLKITPDGSITPATAFQIDSDKTITMPAYGTGIAHFSSAGLISSSLIVDADVSASAAIAITKIANGTANQLIKANAGATANEFATLSGGTGLSVTFGVGTIALANTGVTSIVAGTGISISGATGAVTVNSTITQYTDENAQDAVGAMVANSTKVSLTYVDATPSLTADIIAGSLVNADISNSAAIAFSKLATLTSGNVIYGVANVATSTALNTIAVTALTGTSNQVNVSASVGSVTLSTPQNIHTAATPTFAGLTLSGFSTGIVHSSVAGVLSSSLIVDADVSASAAITRSKLASGSADHVVINSGTGVLSSEANLAVSRGGTGTGTLTLNNVILGNGTSAIQFVAPSTSGNVLTSNGTTWTSAPAPAASVSIGSTVTSGTTGSVLFIGASSALAQDNSNFFYTDADDSLGLGPSASTNSYTVNGSSIKHRLSVHANKAGTDLVDLALFDGSTTASQSPRLDFARNKNTIASPTVVASGDFLGKINFLGYDGTDYELAASINCSVDTTPGSNDMPGRITVNISPDGSSTPIEYFRFGGTGDRIQIYNDQPTVTASEDVMSYIPTFSCTAASGTVNHALFNYMPTTTIAVNGAAAIQQQYVFQCSPNVTFNSGLSHIYYAFLHQGTFTYTANPGFANTFSLFVGNPTMVSNTATVQMPNTNIYQANIVYNAGNVAVGTTLQATSSFVHSPQYNCTGASSSMTSASVVCVQDQPTFKSNTVGAALTINNRIGYSFGNFGSTTTGTVTITNNVGIDLVDQSATGGNLTVSNLYGIRSALTSGTNRWFLYSSGSAQSAITGNLRLGDTTAPTALLDVIGKFLVDTNGKVTEYNDIATVSKGIPSILATVDLTGQTAAVATTTLYAVPASGAGVYRVNWYAKVTTAATTSSTLGALTITFTDPSGVAVTMTAAGLTNAGAIATTRTTNSTTNTGVLNGVPLVINANNSTNIQYAFAYASSGATAMQYTLRIKLEAL